jgi:hypothetical protein
VALRAALPEPLAALASPRHRRRSLLLCFPRGSFLVGCGSAAARMRCGG